MLSIDILEAMKLVTWNIDTLASLDPETATIEVDENASPKFCSPRKLPYALEIPVKA